MTGVMHTAAAKPVASPAHPTTGRTSAVSHLPALAPAELAFLLDLLREPEQAPPAAFPAGSDPVRLWEYIERHGLGGVLGERAGRVAGLPDVLAEAARHRYWSNCLHGEQARRRCAALVDAARRKGLALFFVKGLALVDQGYGEDGLRGFSDLDVFTAGPEEARALAAASGARVLLDSARLGICGEVWDSGRVVAELEGWPIEIRFPLAGWSGPLFDFFGEARLPEVLWTPNGLPVPPPEWHFLFLLHHLMMHHFFGRFIWFLDLVVLARRWGAQWDWESVLDRSRQLAMSEALAAVTAFCRQHADPAFPQPPPPPGGAWNRAFIRHLVRPRVVAASKRNKQQVSALGRTWAVLHGAASYHLLADAPVAGPLWRGRGGQWTEARVRDVLAGRWRSPWGGWLARQLSRPAPWVTYPLARLLAWLPLRHQPHPPA